MTMSDDASRQKPPAEAFRTPRAEPEDALTARTPTADALSKGDQGRAAKVRGEQKNLERRLADQKLVERLAADNFTGPSYREFEVELIRYGISALCGLMSSGYVFAIAASRGFKLRPTEREVEALVRDRGIREELANATVARALPSFRQRALVDGGWSVEGGASLATYFLGSCLYEFPNEFRKYRAYEAAYDHAIHAAATHPESTCDPMNAVLGNIRVERELANLDDQTRAVVRAVMNGYKHAEIAEMLGFGSARAVEGILYRLRTKMKPRPDKGGETDGGA